jgi:hypothetical protein
MLPSPPLLLLLLPLPLPPPLLLLLLVLLPPTLLLASSGNFLLTLWYNLSPHPQGSRIQNKLCLPFLSGRQWAPSSLIFFLNFF